MTAKLRSYEGTAVPAYRTMSEIDALLKRIGVEAVRWTSMGMDVGLEFAWRPAERPEQARLAFLVRLQIPTEKVRPRYMRALYWYLKAKVEAYQFGLVDLAQEFLPHLLTAPGRTVYDEAQPRIEQRLLGHDMPLLPESKERKEAP